MIERCLKPWWSTARRLQGQVHPFFLMQLSQYFLGHLLLSSSSRSTEWSASWSSVSPHFSHFRSIIIMEHRFQTDAVFLNSKLFSPERKKFGIDSSLNVHYLPDFMQFVKLALGE